MDHRGTDLDAPLLDQLLIALRDPSTGTARLGYADFGEATFQDVANFGEATFEDVARFDSATFQDDADFSEVTFRGGTGFNATIFTGEASFESATFNGYADYSEAIFHGGAGFNATTFEDNTSFKKARFKGGAGFRSASIQGSTSFESATFTGVADFTEVTCVDIVWFQKAVFEDNTSFESATFNDAAGFGEVAFKGVAAFNKATFESMGAFEEANFEGRAGFESVTFEGSAGFSQATFTDEASFDSATFNSHALFREVAFAGDASFESATFTGEARFREVTFAGNASFRSATFEREGIVGPLVCTGQMTLSFAVFSSPVVIAIAARRLLCQRTRWSSTAALQLRYATVDFSHAVFEYPLTIAAEASPFDSANEEILAGASGATVRMVSLSGVDAAHLVLADVDLSQCLLTGTIHLNQLRLEGACSFDRVPSRVHWRRWRPLRFTRRRSLAEEQHWRAARPAAVRGWNTSVFGSEHVGPAQLAPVYRALRKSFEDVKNEPGAADFYYGEMEMRRHDSATPFAERGLLAAYWALSGYGLRATRTLMWLLLAMAGTLLVMMLWGLAIDDPKPVSAGKVTGQDIRLTTDTPDPVNPTGPLHERISTERFEKGLHVVINSVVFRSSDQNLTTTGTYTEMFSRLTEPVLLGVTALAIRNRVKR
ncbi:pentapeptide repeat-containing protein [Streptomyces sp. NBC_00385]|uniref:pentapeptide repeat-containing protein n=1 Tax=Streptomyces sp. NBC_00385 TaxID=2975733 RepID=UPI002DDAE367|nr:pentapeptide repeat-containing protein [Streptomyces sp. NBC_00385]WRZ06896.1 pentapeptide repeat-containing protein [Streptomyces sp. NBC_00385]